MNKINDSIICAGFGGQGIMTLGKILAEAGMESGLNVTWMPSYGAEVRGGTAHSMVRISREPIASPLVQKANVMILMNKPSLERFEKELAPGGLLIVNSSLAKGGIKRSGRTVIEVPLTEEAMKIGNVKVANMIAAGIYAAKRDFLKVEFILSSIIKTMQSYEDLIKINIQAVERGIEIVHGM